MDEDLCLHSILFMPENGLMQEFQFFQRLVMAQYTILEFHQNYHFKTGTILKKFIQFFLTSF